MTNINKKTGLNSERTRRRNLITSTKFYARKDRIPNPGIERNIYCRITYNAQQIEFFTGIKVPNFAFTDGRINPLDDTLKEKQRILDTISLNVLRIHNDLVANKSIVTPGIIRNIMLESEGLLKTFNQIFIEFLEKRKKLVGKEISQIIYNRELQWHKEIIDYLKSLYKTENFEIDKLNPQFVDSFLHHLITEKNLSNDVALRRVEIIKRVIDYAISKGYYKSVNILRSVNHKRQNKPKLGFLTADQVKRLQNHYFENERYRLVKDAFLFQCFTGLSFVDLERLTTENLFVDKEKREWIKINRSKTDALSIIPLLPEAKEIIDRYKNFKPLTCRVINTGRLMPLISNAEMNYVLKAFAGIVNVPEKMMCTHTARKTFATIALNSEGVSMETVSAMLGHANTRITSKYYAKVNIQKIDREMSGFSFFKK